MIKKIAWNAFKNTGDINAFLELKEIENIEKNIIENKDINDIKIEEKNINQRLSYYQKLQIESDMRKWGLTNE